MSLIVGFCEVLQQTPLAMTFAPPLEVTLPSQVAEVSVILETLFVVTVGTMGFTVTVLEAVAVQPSLYVPVTIYVVVLVGLTVMLAVFAPVLHR